MDDDKDDKPLVEKTIKVKDSHRSGIPHSFRPTEQKPFQLTSFWTDP